jgi:hypothetical protein
MKICEVVFNRQAVDQTLPYDDDANQSAIEYSLRAGELWRGPHEERYLTLLLRGIKPAALIDPEDLPRFQKYIDDKTLSVGEAEVLNKYPAYVVTLPGQEWRIKKINDLFTKADDYWDAGKQKLWHSRLGILLGYTNHDIRPFINLPN